MDRGDVLSGAAFTAVLRSAIVFLLILVAVGWAALTYVQNNLQTEIREDVKEHWDILAADHQTEGADSVVETIRHVRPLYVSGVRALAIFDEGRRLAGNVITQPPGEGFQRGPLDHEAPLVHEMMRNEVLSVSPTKSIVDLAQEMLGAKPKVYPVTEQGRLVGIVTRRDVLTAVLTMRRHQRSA